MTHFDDDSASDIFAIFFRGGKMTGQLEMCEELYITNGGKRIVSNASTCTPEARLVAEIVWRAYQDLTSTITYDGLAIEKGTASEIRRSAREFFLSDDVTSESGFTFLFCADILNLDAAQIRRALKNHLYPQSAQPAECPLLVVAKP